MRKFFVMVLAAATIWLTGLSARAEVPTLIPVVGVLTDTDDAPLDGDLSVVFTLYTEETGGVTLWGETQTVEFEDGLFRVYLGAETVDGLDIIDFVDNDEVWLGVRVGADGEMNRVRMASVPWAFEAETCGQVTDLAAAGIQQEIAADACAAGFAMRGWDGSAAVCVALPDVSDMVANTDIGTTVQAPIDQGSFPCNYGIEQISSGGAVVCANQDVVTQCGPEAGLGSNDNYLGSDGVCHKAVHSCTANQYLAGGATGTCQEASHKCTANQYLDGDGTCQEAPHKCLANEFLDGDGTCRPSGFGLVPIGSIVAWHKSFTNTPALPVGWVECNGQTIGDSSSPYYNQQVPNLNGASSAGNKGWFLRGHTASGETQTHGIQDHAHNYQDYVRVNNTNCWAGGACTGGYYAVTGNEDYLRTSYGANGASTETRPYNWSVVWVIRIR